MIVKRTTSLAIVGALAVSAAAMLNAQGGRGGGPAARAGTGTVEHVTVHGKALEGNLEADSPDREVTVYLPPSYAGDQTRRYPVVYLLHGYGGGDNTFNGRLAKLPESADRLAAAQGFSELIVVTPNAFSLHKGSMYSNSVTTGDWERFVAEDLVTDAMAPAVAIKTRAQAEEAARAPGFGPSVSLASAAAWSPNPKNPPLYLDLPVKDDKVRPDIVAKRAANAPLTMLDHYVPALKSYYQIAIDIGTKDDLMASNRQLHEAMTRLTIPHSYDEYDGDHTNMVGERIERNVLPYFSKNLASPANPTSPQVQ